MGEFLSMELCLTIIPFYPAPNYFKIISNQYFILNYHFIWQNFAAFMTQEQKYMKNSSIYQRLIQVVRAYISIMKKF